METIVALSTPAGRGGIGIIRLSGKPLPIVLKLFSSKEITGEIMPKYMYFGTVSTRGFKDTGYMVYFKAPKSYTGEDVVELHVHGGTRIVEGVIEECVRLGARPAERGEYTRRAFLNGKMTLADAEGVIDMINADSEVAVRAAYREMTGHLTRAVEGVQAKLLSLIASLEVQLDYPEETADYLSPDAEKEMAEISVALQNLLSQKSYGRLVKDGMRVVIVGDTNVGKSSLMNAMLGYDRAIVSSVKGTTRDVVSEGLEYKGKKLVLTDTAGIRESGDIIEKEGVKRAISAIKSADLVVRVYDATKNEGLSDSEIDDAANNNKCLNVYNKKDLVTDTDRQDNALYVSAKSGEGVRELLDKISEIFDAEKTPETEVSITSRHYFAVERALSEVKSAEADYKKTTVDCVIASLNSAWSSLGEITGVTLPEDILDFIFENFCVGK